MTTYPIRTIRACLLWRRVSGVEGRRETAIRDLTKFNTIWLDNSCCGVELKLNASPMKLSSVNRTVSISTNQHVDTRDVPEIRKTFAALHVRARITEGVDVFRVVPAEAG